MLRCIINALKEDCSFGAIAVTAPTGIAACNIGGCTIHSFAGIGIGEAPAQNLLQKIEKSKTAMKRWQECKVLIIDEISMLEADLFDKLEFIARRIKRSDKLFGGIQVDLIFSLHSICF